jgi:hypothetical protein
MPTISEFFGILILMHVREHMPPHFHARYAGEEVLIAIKTGEVIQNRKRFSRRALRIIEEWRLLHMDELLENWDRAMHMQMPKKIKPLV